MKIWIDFSNSPHPLLFAPIIRRLHGGGHEVAITARDNAQTVDLARGLGSPVSVIGGESPPDKVGKVRALGRRIVGLRRWATRVRPDVALSHNSYAQIVAAQLLGIPSVTAMDFEHQPANHLAFRLASRVLVPAAIPTGQLKRQGASPGKLIQYEGLKEEIYLGDFEPDGAILEKVGIARPRVLVVARTPPTRAVYHPAENPLFEEAIRVVCAQADTACVVLCRHPEQIAALRGLALPNCIVPRTAIDSRSLLYAADLMIGAGGTMTREAALLGIPTWTLFAGTPPAVDAHLQEEGRLARLTDAALLAGLSPRETDPRTPEELRARAIAIQDVFVTNTVAAGQNPSRRDPHEGAARNRRAQISNESRPNI